MKIFILILKYGHLPAFFLTFSATSTVHNYTDKVENTRSMPCLCFIIGTFDNYFMTFYRTTMNALHFKAGGGCDISAREKKIKRFLFIYFLCIPINIIL